MPDLMLGSLVSVCVFCARVYSGSLTRKTTTPEIESLQQTIRDLQSKNARLAWELKMAEEGDLTATLQHAY